MKRKLRMGMAGGGPEAFIGGVHRMAARLDGGIDLVCGAFSRDPAKSRAMAEELFLAPERCYPSFEEMFARESALPADKRMDFVAIVTPNRSHHAIARAALDHGFHVLCDKPMTYTLDEARDLRDRVRSTGLVFALMHNYSCYPMVRQMRALVRSGAIGKPRKIVAEYDLGWLASPNAGKQAAWRVDPEQAGVAACFGDIGTHAAQLVEFTTGLRVAEVCADLSTFVAGRKLDDDGSVLFRVDNGARGIISVSEVASGEENRFALRLYGDVGSLEWVQQTPEDLFYRRNDEPMRVYRRAWAGMAPEVATFTRLPAGHPEGFIEAFANVYKRFAEAVSAYIAGKPVTVDFPDVNDGVRGMLFIQTVVESSKAGGVWRPLPES